MCSQLPKMSFTKTVHVSEKLGSGMYYSEADSEFSINEQVVYGQLILYLYKFSINKTHKTRLSVQKCGQDLQESNPIFLLGAMIQYLIQCLEQLYRT